MIRQIAGGLVCLLMTLYWLGVAQTGSGQSGRFQMLLAALAIIVALFIAGAALAARRSRAERVSRAGALGLATFALGGPPLLNAWIRGGDQERYVWIISQAFPCNTMGGGPGSLWVLATSWMFAVGALAVCLGGGGASRRTVIAGMASGSVLLALAAITMFPRPEIFATILGCR